MRLWSWHQGIQQTDNRKDGYILSKAYEVLMVGVDVGQLNVNQQQNL